MSQTAVLIDYYWCSGCHTCEIACQMEHGYPAGQSGIVVSEVGPWKIADEKWQDDNVPSLTNLCDLCAERRAKGKKAACELHCQANCIKIGNAEDFVNELSGPKRMIVVP